MPIEAEKANPMESLRSVLSQSEGCNTLLGVDWTVQPSAKSSLKA
jgi:hypothetical protein